MPATLRFTLGPSRLTGPAAHHEQLVQLLNAPVDYWKAQTPVPLKPVTRAAVTADGSALAELVLADGVTLGQAETLLVLMAARMPQINLELRVEGAADGLTALRLVFGKLEAGRKGPGGEIAWTPLPHHSTLIGSK